LRAHVARFWTLLKILASQLDPWFKLQLVY
jgi:hypothetical protein